MGIFDDFDPGEAPPAAAPTRDLLFDPVMQEVFGDEPGPESSTRVGEAFGSSEKPKELPVVHVVRKAKTKVRKDEDEPYRELQAPDVLTEAGMKSCKV